MYTHSSVAEKSVAVIALDSLLNETRNRFLSIHSITRSGMEPDVADGPMIKLSK